MKTLQIAFPEDLHERIKDEARRRRLTMTDTIRAVMHEHLPVPDPSDELGPAAGGDRGGP